MTGAKREPPEITVAYLVNLYPKISHSFIRREIQALESQGVVVHRFAIRRTAEPLVDDADREELAKTKVLLELGPASLFLSRPCAMRKSTSPRLMLPLGVSM